MEENEKMVQIQIDLKIEGGVMKIHGIVLQGHDAVTKEVNLGNDIVKNIQESLASVNAENNKKSKRTFRPERPLAPENRTV